MVVITEDQKNLVIEASKLMQQNVEELGIIYFTEIFKLDPSLKDRFSFLPKDGDPADAVKHTKLVKHAATVFKMVCDGVVQICDKGELELDTAILEHMTSVHNSNDVLATDFPVYVNALPKAAQEFLGAMFTDDMGKALKIAHAALVEYMTSFKGQRDLIRRLKETNRQLAEAGALLHGPE